MPSRAMSRIWRDGESEGALHPAVPLGPSDSSDSGSDVQGPQGLDPEWGADGETDAGGTGERAAADGSDGDRAADLEPDRVIELSANDVDAGGGEPGDEDDATDDVPVKAREPVEPDLLQIVDDMVRRSGR